MFVADMLEEKTNLVINPIVKQKMSKREEELTKNGWMKQNTIGEPRLSECVELYESLDYEVHLEPVHPNEMTEECRKCYEKELGTVRTIYTRKKHI